MRSEHSTTRARLSNTWKAAILQAFEYCGFTDVTDVGGKRRNQVGFTDHTGTLENATFEFRCVAESNIPTLRSEIDRMAWATTQSAKYHAFWVRTETQDFFALFLIKRMKDPFKSSQLFGDQRHTSIANFDLAEHEIILLFDGKDFSVAGWDGFQVAA